MSFHYQARRVRDPGHPPWLRLSSLRACVRSYCTLTGASYARVGAYLEERERNASLEQLRAFEKKRVRAKSHGNRQLSTAERTALREMRGGIG